MAGRLRDGEIDQNTLTKYLDTQSDFDFELRILKMMRDHRLPCEHGGHYVDPVTQKSREFDIRCRVRAGMFRVQIAIECKNLRKNFPLLVSAAPRTRDETYHEFALVADLPEQSTDFGFGRWMPVIEPPGQSRASVRRFGTNRSHDHEGQPVGK